LFESAKANAKMTTMPTNPMKCIGAIIRLIRVIQSHLYGIDQ